MPKCEKELWCCATLHVLYYKLLTMRYDHHANVPRTAVSEGEITLNPGAHLLVSVRSRSNGAIEARLPRSCAFVVPYPFEAPKRVWKRRPGSRQNLWAQERRGWELQP